MFWVFDMAKEVANIVCVGRAGNYIYVPRAKPLGRELPIGENFTCAAPRTLCGRRQSCPDKKSMEAGRYLSQLFFCLESRSILPKRVTLSYRED